MTEAHIDVVPGRALDAQYYEANLHRTDTGTTLKTSLKKHIDTVRGSGRADAIRVCTDNLSTGVVVMKSAKDGV